MTPNEIVNRKSKELKSIPNGFDIAKRDFLELHSSVLRMILLKEDFDQELVEEMTFMAFVLIDMDDDIYFNVTTMASCVYNLLEVEPFESFTYLSRATKRKEEQ